MRYLFLGSSVEWAASNAIDWKSCFGRYRAEHLVAASGPGSTSSYQLADWHPGRMAGKGIGRKAPLGGDGRDECWGWMAGSRAVNVSDNVLVWIRWRTAALGCTWAARELVGSCLPRPSRTLRVVEPIRGSDW
jgi:hypothetical protein